MQRSGKEASASDHSGTDGTDNTVADHHASDNPGTDNPGTDCHASDCHRSTGHHLVSDHPGTDLQAPGLLPGIRMPSLKPRITVIDYDESHYHEAEVKSVEERFLFQGRPFVTWINIDCLRQDRRASCRERVSSPV